ncbi:MAG: prepilin-type N-terminal cleavage/methylation domain-containing protein [Terrimicrobiaceae bacterium]
MRNWAASRPSARLQRVDSFRISHFAFQIAPRPRGAFTLFEVILSLLILALLTGAVYSITSAATETTKATMEEQVSVRRMEAFLKVVRDAFLNLPREGKVQLRFSKSATGAPVPEIIFEDAAGLFGIPSLGGGSLILAARPRADGSRVLSILRVSRDLQGADLERLKAGNSWIPLLPRVEKVKWSFFANGEWRDEWLPENGRPQTARLEMEYLDMGASKIDAQFWIPPLAAEARQQQPPAPTPVPTP